MSMTVQTQSISFGDFVAAVFDQAERELTPTLVSRVATRVVTAVLVRSGNMRVVQALQTRRHAHAWSPWRRAVA